MVIFHSYVNVYQRVTKTSSLEGFVRSAILICINYLVDAAFQSKITGVHRLRHPFYGRPGSFVCFVGVR